jgi:hypothetical protein
MKTLIAWSVCLLLLAGCSDDASATAEAGTGTTGPDATSTGSAATGTVPGVTQTSSGAADTGSTAADTSGSPTDTGASEDTTGASTESSSEASTGGDLFPDGLECMSVSLCSTYDADPSAPPFPDAPGGVLEDGLYRAVQGSSEPFGLAIAGDRYALIFEGLTTAFGDLTVEGVVMTQTQTAACSSNGLVELEPQPFDYVIWTDGNELFTYSGCDSLNPDACGSGTRYVRVDSLCEDLGSLSCEGGGCECHTFTDEMPEDPGGCAF